MNDNKLDHYQKIVLWILYRMVAKQWQASDTNAARRWDTLAYFVAHKIAPWDKPSTYDLHYRKNNIRISMYDFAYRCETVMGLFDKNVVMELLEKAYIRVEANEVNDNHTIILTRRGFVRGWYLNQIL